MDLSIPQKPPDGDRQLLHSSTLRQEVGHPNGVGPGYKAELPNCGNKLGMIKQRWPRCCRGHHPLIAQGFHACQRDWRN